MTELVGALDVGEVERAAKRLRGHVVRTPLVPFADGARDESGRAGVYLKLENLQPIGSFKLRGAGNFVLSTPDDELGDGFVTPSAGNMAQGVAWHARRLGVPCHVLVPDTAPRAKLDAIERLGGEVHAVPFDAWWRALVTRDAEGLPGSFVHPAADARVIHGNGTIGLELLDDLPRLDTVLVPFGGGGLLTGVALAVKASRPDVRVLAVEVETAAPLTASLAAGAPTSVERVPSFVDGIGGTTVLDEMWPALRGRVDGTVVVSLAETADAIRRLALETRVVAEGAGGAALAAALRGADDDGRPFGTCACIVSGGNLDAVHLRTILAGPDGSVP